jgi:predicted nucleic acid-binding Zn ribbon protein
MPKGPEKKYDKPWKPWRPKLRVHAGPPQTTNDLMGEVLARLGGQGRAKEFRVFDCYTRVVGGLLRARTAPERLRDKTLVVRVASSALAHELTLMRGEILARLAAELGPDVVTELRTKVGRVDAPDAP